MEKAREWNIQLHFCFIDYIKAVGCTDHKKPWKMHKTKWILFSLFKNLYVGHEATVSKEFGNTNRTNIGKGVRQRCILSPDLLNVYSETFMRRAESDSLNGSSLGGRTINNLTLNATLVRHQTGSGNTDTKGVDLKRTVCLLLLLFF